MMRVVRVRRIGGEDEDGEGGRDEGRGVGS